MQLGSIDTGFTFNLILVRSGAPVIPLRKTTPKQASENEDRQPAKQPFPEKLRPSDSCIEAAVLKSCHPVDEQLIPRLREQLSQTVPSYDTCNSSASGTPYSYALCKGQAQTLVDVHMSKLRSYK